LDPNFAGVFSGLDLGTSETFISSTSRGAGFQLRRSLCPKPVRRSTERPAGSGLRDRILDGLVDWTLVLHEFATNTVLTLADPNSAGPGRFYRAGRNPTTVSPTPTRSADSCHCVRLQPGCHLRTGRSTSYFNQISGAGTPVWWTGWHLPPARLASPRPPAPGAACLRRFWGVHRLEPLEPGSRT